MKNHSTLSTVVGAAALILGVGLSGLHAQSTTTYNFSILAGNGAVLDHTNGASSSARLFNPVGLAIDTGGNILVADAGDHTLRRISGSSVSTVAGTSGQAGTDSGHFVYPVAVAVDGAGNTYVADMGDNTIRKLSGSSASVFAGGSGSGAAGYRDGQGANALFNGPQGIAVDGQGNVYVADTNNSVIRKITPGGLVSTLAGSAGVSGSTDGSTGSALFNFPSGIATDPQGNVYVADYDNSTIRKIGTDGSVATIAGSAGATGAVNGVSSAARFDHPNALSLDAAGNIYVLDTSNQLVRKISPTGVTTVAGTADQIGHADGSGVAASFFYPLGLVALNDGTVYVADTGNHTVRQVSPGGSVSTIAGAAGAPGLVNGGDTSAVFNYPYGVTIDGSGNLYIADAGNNAIRKIDATGMVSTLAGGNITTPGGTTTAGSADGAVASFNNPSAVAVDGQGNVYVADTANSTIRKITPSGVTSTYAGAAGSQGSADGALTAARFNRPQGITIDSKGNLYVADTENNTVRLITAAGQVSTFLGSAGQIGTADNTRNQARFNRPTSVALDSAGNLYIADFSNNTIRKADANGNVSTLAGLPGAAGDADGSGTNARFNQPSQIAVDSGGNVFVTDTFNRAIRVVNTSGQVYTIGGAQSRFYYPQGIAIDSAGKLYVVDGDNQSVSVGIPVVVVAPSNGQISSHTIAPGGSTTFTYTAGGAGSTYQWQVSTNGSTYTNIAGATGSSYMVSNASAAMNGYQYRVVVNGNATSSGTLYVGTARLINLSSRANVINGNTVTAAFVAGGNGTESVLVRAIGPTLANYSVTNALTDPTLTFVGPNQNVILTNTGWGGSTALSNAMSQVGAFSLAATSADSAMLQNLSLNGSNNSYSAQITSVGHSSGNVLAEVYDMNTSSTATPGTRLINISTQAFVDSTGNNNLVSGFVITGNTKETVLIRGDGPSLAAYGVSNPVATPILTVYQPGNPTPIATNTGWGSSAAISSAAASVYAFALTPNSADAAVLLSLDPGTYTAQVSGNGGASGTTVLEIYEVK